jgi:hypothetical protein
MFTNPYQSLIIFMILVMFFFGLGIMIAGAIVLIRRAADNSLQAIGVQTAKLAQKGIAEDVAGLVGNAANLLDSMNQLTRTTRGVGIVLVVLGGLMIAGSCVFAYYVYQLNIIP